MKRQSEIDFSDHHMIGPFEVCRIGQTVRAPLPLLRRLTADGSGDINAHRWDNYCGRSGVWYDAEYRSIAAAKNAFARLCLHPAARSIASWMRLSRGEI